MQCVFGFLGDRYGRKWFISGGLVLCVFGLVLMAGVGVNEADPRAGFFIAALSVGFGTGVLYTNLLAAICDHADPSWRSSALGAYRFWRDLGYGLGALGIGLAAHVTGRVETAFWFVAICMFASGAILWRFGEETHPQLNPAPAGAVPETASRGSPRGLNGRNA